jgi:hypothetical protein
MLFNQNNNIENFYVTCPHCKDIVYITKVKCALFIHAYNKKTYQPLNPHLKWYKVDEIRNKYGILGCGKRFKIDKNNGFISPIND